MAEARRSSIAFLDSRSRERIDALEDTRIMVSSAPLAWPGVTVEVGHNEAWEVDELTVADHYLAMNLDPVPLTFEVKGARGFGKVTLNPGAAWVCPAGEPFTHRVSTGSDFALVTLEPAFFARLVGRESSSPPIARRYGLEAPQLEHLVKALVVEADRGNPTGVPFVEAVAGAMAHQLVTLAGCAPPAPVAARGGLAPGARRRVLELIEARLADGLTVAMLAREAGLSESHFARSFRESTGRSPHQFILVRRLEVARRMLERPGATPSTVAQRTGFSDQAHFTRLFKREFGVTPGVVVRGRR